MTTTMLQSPAAVQGAPPPRAKRLYRHDELHSLPPPAWLIDQQIPANGLTVLFGPSGAGKSFVALDYAAKIARSSRPLQPVIYVAAEGGSGYSARVRAWEGYHRQPCGALCFWLDAINLLDAGAVQGFLDEVRPLRPALVIIDTLARCMWGDENSARDMGAFIQACNAIQRALNAAVLVVHHTGKSGVSERGSSALRGAADMMIELTNDDGLIRMACSKAKDAPEFEPRYLRLVNWEIEPGLTSCVVVPSSRRVEATGDRLTPIQTKILETLALETFIEHGVRAATLQAAAKIDASSTFYRAASQLLRLGYITKDGKYDPYRITEEGSAYLKG
jgi:hypothetical protein